MNLSDYITLTLIEIAEGVSKTDAALKTMGGYLLKKSPVIDGTPFTRISSSSSYPIIKVGFRVGVEVEESMESNNKIGGSLKVISANVGAMTKGVEKSIHEVSFELPLILPE